MKLFGKELKFNNNKVYHSGDKPTTADINAIKGTYANEHWGFSSPDGNTTEYIRTTRNGIIPYYSGGASALGSPSWPFNEAYANKVHADTVICRAFGNGVTTLMHNNLDGNNKNLGWSGSKFAQLSAKAVYGDSGNVSDIKAKENVREIQTRESLLRRDVQRIINENPDTLDLNTNVTMEDMFKFIKDELQLYQYNYKHEEKYEIEGAFNEKIGFIANEVADSKVGKRFVAEHEGELAYNLNNFVFILAAALQEEIKKREALEMQMNELKLNTPSATV